MIEDSPVTRAPRRSSCTTRSTKKKSLGNRSTAIALSGESLANGSIRPLRGPRAAHQHPRAYKAGQELVLVAATASHALVYEDISAGDRLCC